MRAVGALAVALVGCAVAFACDRSPTIPQSPGLNPSLTGKPPGPPTTASEPAGRPNSLHRIELLPCSPLPETEVRVIGPAGGSISVGPHTLLIPAGALAFPAAITAESDDRWYNSVRLYPHGLKFRTTAHLTMSYANCDVGDGSRLQHVQVVYTHASNIVEYEPSDPNLADATVTGDITHFSNYAVAW